MNYIDYFKKGGNTAESKKLAEKIFAATNALQIPEEVVNTRLSELVQANDVESMEVLQLAVDSFIQSNGQDEQSAQTIIGIFQPENQSVMFKCGGKLQQLTDKFTKGGKSKCGCNGIKVAKEGADTEEEPKVKYKKHKDGSETLRMKGNRKGYWTETEAKIENGDTTLTQKVATSYGHRINKINKDDSRYEPIMKDLRKGLPKKQEGGIVFAQDGAHVEYTTGAADPNKLKLNKKQAKQLAKQNKGFDSGNYNKAYWNAKNALRQQGLRGKDLRNAARVMVSGVQQATPSLVVDTQTPQVLQSFEGPRKYEGVTEVGPLTMVGTSTKKPTIVKPIVKEDSAANIPSVRDSIAADVAKTNAWNQYQYERGVYDYKNGVNRPNQGSAAYQHWMWDDFNKAYDANTGTVKRDFLMHTPTQEELLRFNNAGAFTHGALNWYGQNPSQMSQKSYDYLVSQGVDPRKFMFYSQDDSRYRADAAAKGIAPTDDLYNGTAGIMGTMLAPAFGAAAEQAINGISNLAVDAYTGFNPTGVVMKRPGVIRSPKTGKLIQGRAANGTFTNNKQGSWFMDIFNGQRVPGYKVGALKIGGLIKNEDVAKSLKCGGKPKKKK